MYVINQSTKEKHQIEISLVDEVDFKSLKITRYFFDWNTEKEFEIYKLCIQGTNDSIGLISLERIPEEWRIHIRLLTVSKENKGQNKKYDRIAGNLIAHAAKIAVKEYAEYACVSLRPKTEIAKHYINKYDMKITGMTLSIEVPEILTLINKYDHE
jgi:ribosomal protein S6E (S10)